MKILFLDFDGVITTYETGWTISLDKLALVDRIINETGARIVVTSSWKHGYSNVDGFKNSICNKRCSRTMWRNRCSGLDKDNGIDEMLKEYYNRF